MKCSKCKKKRSRFICDICYNHTHFKAINLDFSKDIQIKRRYLEEKVANLLNFYFEKQDFLEFHHENQRFLTISSQCQKSLKSQEILIKSLEAKILEKARIRDKLLLIRTRFIEAISDKKIFLAKSAEKLAFYQKKLLFLQSKKLEKYDKILEINTIYPRFSIYKEIKMEKIEEIIPLDEEDIDDFDENPQNNQINEYRITFIKNSSSFNEIYGEIMSFSLNQLAKILLFTSKIYDIYLPLVMILDKNTVIIGNFMKDYMFYCVKNVNNRRNYRNSQKFLVLLLMNFKFLMKTFGFHQDFRSFGYVNWPDFYEKIRKKNMINSDKNNDNSFTFSLIKVEFPFKKTRKNEKFEENSLILIKSSSEFSEKDEKQEKNVIKPANFIETKQHSNDSSFEILDSFSDLNDDL